MKLSRRDYLKISMLGAGAFALPNFALGLPQSSNSKLNIALIGGGTIAKTSFRDCQQENVVAITEVDDVTGAPGYEAFPNAQRYNKKVIYNPESMTFSDSSLNAYIKEPVRDGWDYREGLILAFGRNSLKSSGVFFYSNTTGTITGMLFN